MLQYVIVVSNTGNTGATVIRPLDARSLALSVLLGSHPPRLPARALVALGELFGIPSGTTRTALSRMVASGEIVRSEAHYGLTGRLLDRQRSQDAGRSASTARWNGAWHTIVTVADQRQVSERRRFRSLMANHRFGELRPDIWMRPANLDRPAADPDWICSTGELSGIDADALAGRLWPLASLAAEARGTVRRLDELAATTDWDDERSIPELFTFSATVVRFLRSDPLLPPELTPSDWPIDLLRVRYDRFERAHQQLLRAFLRSA